MKKNIVVIFEKHDDLKSIGAYPLLFRHLKENFGFDTWATETGASTSLEELKAIYDGYILNAKRLLQFISSNPSCLENSPDTSQHITDEKILELSYNDKISTIVCAFSKAHSRFKNIKIGSSEQKVITDAIRSLTHFSAQKLQLQILAEINTFMQIQGVDDNNAAITKHSAEYFISRNIKIIENIAKLHDKGKKPILTVGKYHMPGVILALHSKGLLDETLFIDLHSKHNAMTTYNQNHLVKTLHNSQQLFAQLNPLLAKELDEIVNFETTELVSLAQNEILQVNILSLNVFDSSDLYFLPAIDVELTANNQISRCLPQNFYVAPNFFVPTTSLNKSNRPLLFSNTSLLNEESIKYSSTLLLVTAILACIHLYLKTKNINNHVTNVKDQSNDVGQQGVRQKNRLCYFG